MVCVVFRASQGDMHIAAANKNGFLGCNSSLQFSGRYNFSQFSFYQDGSQHRSGSRQVLACEDNVLKTARHFHPAAFFAYNSPESERTVRDAGIRPRHFQLQ